MKEMTFGGCNFFFLVCIIIAGCSQQANELSQTEEFMQFRWNIVYRTVDTNYDSLDILNEQLHSLPRGEYKFLIQPVDNIYVYLFMIDSQKEISLLFPKKFADFNDKEKYKMTDVYQIPANDRWFRLKEEISHIDFFLFASTTRLNKIEKLMHSMDGASDIKQQSLKINILEEIKAFALSIYPAKIDDDRLPYFGRFRNINEEILLRNAKDIESTRGYIKKISIKIK